MDRFSYLLNHSPNVDNSQGWVRPELHLEFPQERQGFKRLKVSWCLAGCAQQEAGTEAEQPGLSGSLFSQWHKARPLRFLKVLFTWSHRDRVRGRRKKEGRGSERTPTIWFMSRKPAMGGCVRKWKARN